MPPEQDPRHPIAENRGQPSWIAPVKPVVPDHELLVRIGGGSYGDVWLARSVVGTWRAVKVVFRDRFLDPRPYEREFNGIQKFEPLSRSNEGFVDILQIGRNDAEGYFYYVMELADDATDTAEVHPETYVPKTLAKALLQRGRLPVSECLELGITLNLALARLHSAGLIHRDIKPSNLIFVGGIPKLADIGLVIEFAEARSYVGTEGFIPPEGPNSPQADLYSLGKVLYEAGMGKDRKDFPEPPTQIGEVPDSAELLEFNAILLKACAANVKDRYQSAEEMNADLALLQSGGSVRRQRTLTRRLRSVQRAGVLVTVLAAVIGAGWFWQARQTQLVRALASEKTRLAAEKTQLANEHREQLVRLDVANGVRLMDLGDYSGALLWLAEALPLVTNNPTEESVHRIRIQQLFKQSPGLVHVLFHGDKVNSSSFNPDARQLATTDGRQLRIWDTESGKLLLAPAAFEKSAMSARYSSDGKRLLLGSCYDHVRPYRQNGKSLAAVIDATTGWALWPAITNVNSAAFSADDRWLAVSRYGSNFVVEVFDTMDGRRILELRGHTNEVGALTFSIDGQLLASASDDKTVRVWAIPSGKPVAQPILHNNPVQQVAFSRDARALATSEAPPFLQKRALVHTWQTRTGTEVGQPIPVQTGAYCLTFDESTGQRLLVSGGDNWVSVLDSETHSPMCPNLALGSAVVRCWGFSPDSLRFAAGSEDGTVRVWDLETGEPLTPLLRHAGSVASVQFSPDGSRLASTSDEEGTAKIWNLASMADATKRLDFPGQITSLNPQAYHFALSQNGKRLLLPGRVGTIQLLNLEKLTEDGPPMSSSDSNIVGDITFDSSGHQWACALGNLQGFPLTSWMVDLWREEGTALRHFALPHARPVRFIQFSPDGTRLWTWGEDFRLRSWRTADGNLLTERAVSDTNHWLGGLSPSGERAFMAKEGGDFALFDLREEPPKMLHRYNQSNAAFFSPDGTRLFEINNKEGRICDTSTGKELVRAFKYGSEISWMEWSSDGREVLTAGNAWYVKLWDASTGQQAHPPLELGRSSILVAHYSQDGRFVVARSNEQLVRAWDSTTSEPITPAFRHPGDVRLAIIARGDRLLSLSHPASIGRRNRDSSKINVIRVWDLEETKLSVSQIANYARLLAGRKLDRAGVFQPLNSPELDTLFRSLRTNCPTLFATPDSQLRRWHQSQLPEPDNLTLVRAGEFHLNRLAELETNDPWLKQQQARFLAALPPPRNPATPPNMIDLSDAYTHSLQAPPEKEFQNLTPGFQVLAGNQFDVRGLIFLEEPNPGDVPFWGRLRNRTIKVGQMCRQLHFLQATDGEQGKEGEEVARWVFHYADGSVWACFEKTGTS